MSIRCTKFRTFQFLALLQVASGCGGNKTEGRLPVTGKVSYAGKPIEQGSISFRSSEDPTLPAASAPIADGRYEIPAAKGPKAGSYDIVVLAYRMVKADTSYVPAYLKDDESSDPSADTIPKQFLPKKYNDESTLSVSFNPEQKEYDFELTK